VSQKNTHHTTEGVVKGGKRLAREIVRFLLAEYGLTSPVEFSKVSPEREDNEYLGELKACRDALRKHQYAEAHLHNSDNAGKLQLFAIGHSLGGLYLRNALGWLHNAKFFSKKEGPFSPRVSLLIVESIEKPKLAEICNGHLTDVCFCFCFLLLIGLY
jgi:hypothetical protein